jgi:hypothetical protein
MLPDASHLMVLAVAELFAVLTLTVRNVASQPSIVKKNISALLPILSARMVPTSSNSATAR